MSDFWDTHYTMAEAARHLGCKRQNIKQRADRGSIQAVLSPDGLWGIPIGYVDDTLRLRIRDKVKSDVSVAVTGVSMSGDM